MIGFALAWCLAPAIVFLIGQEEGMLVKERQSLIMQLSQIKHIEILLH